MRSVTRQRETPVNSCSSFIRDPESRFFAQPYPLNLYTYHDGCPYCLEICLIAPYYEHINTRGFKKKGKKKKK